MLVIGDRQKNPSLNTNKKWLKPPDRYMEVSTNGGTPENPIRMDDN